MDGWIIGVAILAIAAVVVVAFVAATKLWAAGQDQVHPD
jgi:hypothetical protein